MREKIRIQVFWDMTLSRWVRGSRPSRRDFILGLLEYQRLSLRVFEKSGSTHLRTHRHFTEDLVAEHRSGSSPSRTTHHEEGKHFFNFFVSAPYLRKDFLTSWISSMFFRSWELWNSLQERDLWKFRSAITFHVDKFMSLTSDPRHIRLFGYTLFRRFVPKENLIEI